MRQFKEDSNMSEQKDRFEETRVTPREHLEYASTELVRAMVVREAVEIMSMLMRSVVDLGIPRSGNASRRDAEETLRKDAWALVEKGNDLFRVVLADWYAVFGGVRMIETTDPLRPPNEVLTDLRNVAYEKLTGYVDEHAESVFRLGSPWSGEPFRRIMQHMRRAIEAGTKGVSYERDVVPCRPMHGEHDDDVRGAVKEILDVETERKP